MDEHLIKEVEKHAIIYNRQKKTIGIKGEEHIGKEFAWVDIASRLGTDVDTCKKRWKYLRERYVQQKKQEFSGGPMYEHLSRPYLEKMKFLDRYIQPRKSYRGLMPNLSNCHNGSQLSVEMPDSLKSNGSTNLTLPVMCRIAEDFQKFDSNRIKRENEEFVEMIPYQQRPSTSSEHEMIETSPSVTSILSPPPQILHSNENTPTNNMNSNSYDADLHHNNTNSDDEDEEDEDVKHMKNERNSTSSFFTNGGGSGNNGPSYSLPFPYPTNFNHQYNNIPQKSHRSSDELLGELVTTELMKMNGERKKHVQKKILEILFFED